MAAAVAGRAIPAASRTSPRPCAAAARTTVSSRISRRLRCRRVVSPTRAARDTGAGTTGISWQEERITTTGRLCRGSRALASPSGIGQAYVRSAPAIGRAGWRIFRRRRGRRSFFRAVFSASLALRRSRTRSASDRHTLPRRSRRQANRRCVGYSTALCRQASNRSTGSIFCHERLNTHLQAWDQVTGGCPRDGYNGVRASHRNAWSLIDTVRQYRIGSPPRFCDRPLA